MFDFLDSRPGLWFVIATLLPLVSFLIILIAFAVRTFVRKTGTIPSRVPAYIATGAMGLAFVCCLVGFFRFQAEYHHDHEAIHALEHQVHDLKHERSDLRKPRDPGKTD